MTGRTRAALAEWRHYDDIAALARHSDDSAVQLGTVAFRCHAALVDPDLLASAVLDLGGTATFEETLLSALDGTGRLSGLVVAPGSRPVTADPRVPAHRITNAG